MMSCIMVVLLLAGHILFRTYGFDNEGLVDDIGLVERLLDHDLIVSMELLLPFSTSS